MIYGGNSEDKVWKQGEFSTNIAIQKSFHFKLQDTVDRPVILSCTN